MNLVDRKMQKYRICCFFAWCCGKRFAKNKSRHPMQRSAFNEPLVFVRCGQRWETNQDTQCKDQHSTNR